VQGFPDGSFDLAVSQAVDDGVEHGGHNGVQQGNDLAHLVGATGVRHQIGNGPGSKKQGHHGEVRGAGGKGPLCPCSLLEDSPEDVNVRHEGEEERAHCNSPSQNIQGGLVEGGVRAAGRLQQEGHLAEQVVDHIGPAEGQAGCEEGLDQRREGATQPRKSH